MKTVYGKLCRECESVRACSQFGCRPIEQDTKRLSRRDWLLIGTAVAFGLAVAVYGIWLS